MRRKIGQPRLIDPSLIEDGDEISVEYKADRGVTTILRGVVAKVVRSGQTRFLMTEEGATLTAWEIGKPTRVKITLIAREEPEQATIFDLPDNMEALRERIAG